MTTSNSNPNGPRHSVWHSDDLDMSERAPLALLAAIVVGAAVWVLAGLEVVALAGGAR